MEAVRTVLQIVVALGIFNVWILRFGKSTGWRGGSASSMKEEFAVYGLPTWFMGVVGALKLLFAAMLIAGIWLEPLVLPAAIGLGVLMLGAIAMHVRVKDPAKKSVPAFTMLVLCILVAVL